MSKWQAAFERASSEALRGLYGLLYPGRMSGDTTLAAPKTKPKRAAQASPAWMTCRRCEARIVLAAAAVSFDGAHQHRFSNPSGFDFVIGLYDEAPGCTHDGAATEYYSWFPGFTWRIAACASCRTHLGWSFECIGTPGLGEPPDFHGLIVDRLRPGA